MKNAIHHVWQLDHPVERVWHYLTDSKLLAIWLMENDFLPVMGHTFQFRTKAKPTFNFDGIIYCQVLEVIPLKKLSYSWRGGSGKGSVTLDSIVTWTLKPNGHGTELILEHTGFRGLKNFAAYFFMNIGWKKKIKKRFTALLIENHTL